MKLFEILRDIRKDSGQSDIQGAFVCWQGRDGKLHVAGDHKEGEAGFLMLMLEYAAAITAMAHQECGDEGCAVCGENALEVAQHS